MRRWLAGVLLAFTALAAGAQTLQTYDFPVPLRCNFVPPTPQDACFLLSQAGGAYVKSVTTGGLATVQLADGTESTVQLASSGGGTWTRGTADPTGGSAGDGYIQVDASNQVQSVWLNLAGTWVESTIPTTGAGVTLSDSVPARTGITSGAPGSSTEVSRADHDHELENSQKLPVTTTDEQIAEWDTTTSRWVAVNKPTGTTNLDIANRDADSLEVTSSTGTDAEIPSATTALAGLQASADKTKLDGIAAGAEVNVQADWNEATTTDDAFIQNKPTIPDAPASWALATGATGTAPPERLPGYTIHRENTSQAYDPSVGVIAFTVDGTLRNGDFIVFDAPSNLGSDDSVNLAVNINSTGDRNLIDREENRINETHLEASAWYVIQRDASSYSVLTNLEDVPTQEQLEDIVGAMVNRGTKSGITVTYTDNADNPGQIDFNVTGAGGGTGSAGEVLVDEISLDWDLEDGPSPAIQLSRALTDDDDLGLVYLDWREWATTDPGEPFRDGGVGMTVPAIRGIADAAPVAVNKSPNRAGNPIDQSVAVAAERVFGAVTIRFPRATAGGGHSDMRLVYIGNHITDTDENLDQTETDITIDSSASLVAGQEYWIVGPLQGCATTYYGEKISVDSIDDGTTITVTRGVGGTGLPVGCQFLTTSDLIEDDKRTFSLLSGHSAHDNAVMTFRLLGSDGGGMADLSDNAPHDVVSGAAAAGSSDDAARSDHVHSGVPAPASTVVSTTYDSAGTVGSHANYARQDHRHGLNKADRFDDGEAPEDVTTGAGSAGSDDTPARRDHVHGGDRNTQLTLSDSAPANVAETGSAGSNSEVSREDHVHGGTPQPADSIVAETITATGTVGSSTTEFAREDHRHGINLAGLFDSTNPEDVGTAAPGSATTAARRDHVHGSDIEDQIELIDSQNDVTYTRADTADLSSRFGGATVYTAELDTEGTADAEINDLIVFQWRDNPAGIPGDRPLGIRINDTGTTLPIRVVDPVNRTLVNKATQDLTRYEFLFLSRQDGVFIQLSSLQLAAAAARLLPSGATDDQIARYDSATSAWVAEDLTAGVGTFIGDTDTPNSYANAARHLPRVTGGETGLEFVPEPSNANTIPHVGRIPDATADSPLLIILTNNQRDGNRQDVTLTIAADAANRYCGYSDGEVFPEFGALTGESPVASVFGIWNATDSNCDLANIYSFNEGFIDDATRIVGSVGGTTFTCDLGTRYQEHGYSTKRITSCSELEDLATGDITINLLDANGDAYWLDGDVIHSPGLYVKLEVNGQLVYHDVTPPEDAHKTGSGSAACGPDNPPTAPGQVCVADGRGYFAMLRQELVTTPPTITVAAAGSDLFIPDLYEPSDLQNRVGLTDGQFIYIKTSQDFYQFQDPDFVVESWTEAWQYIIDNVADTPTRQTFLASVFLGEFASEAEVTRDRDGYTDDSVEYYFLYSDFGTLIHISAFTNSVTTTINAGLAWRGPVLISEEVLEIIEGNPDGAIDESLDSVLVGSRIYSVIVRPGSNGHLREPTAADYNANVVGFDGQWREVGRRLIPGHSASADDSIRSDGSTTAFGGRTYRYRDEHHGDGNVHNARSLDYYWDLRSNRFRWCYETTGNPADCRWSDMHTDSGHFDGVFYQTFNFLGYFESRDDALAAATASGQSAIYARSGGWDFNTFDNVVTAQADQYVYDWRDVQPPAPDDPANVVLVDDLAVTFNAADRPSIEVQFARALTAADDGRPIIIDYRPNASGGNNRATGGAILAEHVRHLTTLRPVALQKDPPGGRNPIDHTEDLPTAANRFAPGHVEFPFPLSSGDNDLHWMRLIYIGDHIDDMDGSFGSGATTITVNNPADFVAGRNYWIVGPISGGGCTPTYHSEKVTVTAIGTPNADDLTVVRGLDGTGLANNCDWVSGADFIEDDKSTFILAATADDQDSGDFTFTLLSQGVGGQASAGSGGGGGILKAKHLASNSTETAVTDGGNHTVMSQAITLAAATDRVFVDAQVVVEGSGNASICDVRIHRGTTELIDVNGAVAFGGIHHAVEAAIMDTPGAGTFTYAVSVYDEAAGTCAVNPDGVESFLVTEILAANQ